MEEETKETVLYVIRVQKGPGGETRERLGSLRLSSEIPQLDIGRKYDLLKSYPQLSRNLLRLNLMKDKKIQMGSNRVLLRDKQNKDFIEFGREEPALIGPTDKILIIVDATETLEIGWEESLSVEGEVLPFRNPPVKRPLSRMRPLLSNIARASPAPKAVVELDDSLNESVDTEPSISPPIPKRSQQTIKVNVGVKVEQGPPPSKKRRVINEDDELIELDFEIQRPASGQIQGPPPLQRISSLGQPQVNQQPDMPRRLNWFPNASRSNAAPLPHQREPAPDQTGSKIAQLREMFPNRSSEILQHVLMVRPDVESAMDLLLAFSEMQSDTLLEHLARANNRPPVPYPSPPVFKTEARADSFVEGGFWRNARPASPHPAFAEREPAPPQKKSPVYQSSSSSTSSTSIPNTKNTTQNGGGSPDIINYEDTKKAWDDILKSHERSLPPVVINFVESALKQLQIGESQVKFVTGGFSFQVWERMRREKINNSLASDSKLVSEAEEDCAEGNPDECRVCMELDPLIAADCGCAVLCSACFTALLGRKDHCPACFKPLAPAKPKPFSLTPPQSPPKIAIAPKKRATKAQPAKAQSNIDDDEIHISPASSQDVVAGRTRMATKAAAKVSPIKPKGAAGRAQPVTMPNAPSPYTLRSATPKRGRAKKATK